MHYPQNEFIEAYRVDDIVFEQYIDFLLNRKIRLDFYGHEQRIKTYIKANLAEQLYSPNLGAQILGGEDRMIERVLELDAEATLEEEKSDGLMGLNR